MVKVESKTLVIGSKSLEELEKFKMGKLVIGDNYYIYRKINYGKSNANYSGWYKYKYLGETGEDNCLLRFERYVNLLSDEKYPIRETYLKNDYLRNELSILTKEEYINRDN